MSKEDYLNKIKQLPDHVKQLSGLAILVIVVLSSFFVLNIIFGEGELRASLEKQITSLGLEACVSLAGYSENVIAEVKAADLFVLSSRFEGSPNAIVEAMSVGTQVVAFDCPHGAREILQGGKVAPLVEYLNVEELVTVIKRTFNSKVESKKLKNEVIRFLSSSSAKHYRNLLLNLFNNKNNSI